MHFMVMDCDGEGVRFSCRRYDVPPVDVIAEAGGDPAAFAREVALEDTLLARWRADKMGGTTNR